MDDFGTGYSSLSYLTLFPYTKLKIDRSLLERIEDDPNVSSVIRSMVGLCRSLNMKIVCEGVETLAQSRGAERGGLQSRAGFLFARTHDLRTADRYLRPTWKPAPRKSGLRGLITRSATAHPRRRASRNSL